MIGEVGSANHAMRRLRQVSSVDFRFERRPGRGKAPDRAAIAARPAGDAREVAERLRRSGAADLEGPRRLPCRRTTSACAASVRARRCRSPWRPTAIWWSSGEAGASGRATSTRRSLGSPPVLDELDYAWVGGAPSASGVRDEILAWLAGELAGGATRIGMAGGSPLRRRRRGAHRDGPRDAAWLAP